MEEQVYFTIIIATFNADKYLQRCITSIIKQSYTNYELILIDGGSNDDTKKIIQKNKDFITCFISEKDKGIYDAWNKGIKLSKGNWILFIGADDCLVKDALKNYVSFINSYDLKDVEFISAKCRFLNILGEEIRVFGKAWSWSKFNYEMIVAHPGSLHRKTLFEKYGFFDTSYKITGDYEFLLRPGSALRAKYLDDVVVDMQSGGVSDNMNAFDEYYRSVRTTGKLSYLSAHLSKFILILRYKGGTVKRKFINFLGK